MQGNGYFQIKVSCFDSNGTVPAIMHGEGQSESVGTEGLFEVWTARLLKKADSIFRTARAYQTRAEHKARSGEAEKPISHDKSS
jgi:hypothetical protein